MYFQVDKDRVANIIAQALQKQTGDTAEPVDAGHTPVSRPVSQADPAPASRPQSTTEPLPLPPRTIRDPR